MYMYVPVELFFLPVLVNDAHGSDHQSQLRVVETSFALRVAFLNDGIERLPHVFRGQARCMRLAGRCVVAPSLARHLGQLIARI